MNDRNLMLSRSLWELIGLENKYYLFSKTELDEAQKRDDGFIGNRNGIGCYIQIKF